MTDRTSRSVAVDESEGEITLGILNAVEENSKLTQRSIAGDLGIALGLANAYLKRCVRKGLIKVQQVPSNRYAYYLTPQGFAEKSRLTSEYLTSSFQFFRRARVQCTDLLRECEEKGLTRIGLVGVSDLAEIVALSAMESKVELAGIVDASVRIKHFAGSAVFPSIEELGRVDALMVTTLKDPQGCYDGLRRDHPATSVLHVSLLRISDKDKEEENSSASSEPEKRP